MSTEENLFADFPPVSRDEWETAIQKDLQGADYKTKLKWQTGEGIEALPFYRRDNFDALPSPISSKQNDWHICQPIVEQDINSANKTARNAIENGADALNFILHIEESDGALGSDVHGPAIQDQESFSSLLDGIDLTNTWLHFDSSLAFQVILAMLHNECKARGDDSFKLNGAVLDDPYAFIITRGQMPNDDEALIHEKKQALEFCAEHVPNIKCLGVDARVYHNAGATIVQELGYALATGSEYLAALSNKGADINTVASAIHFNFSIGSNYFLEIAKFRAARKLWQSVLDAYKVDENHTAHLHGSSSSWNKTMYDPYVNMLRTTTEGMSAAIAGCDTITLHPFDKTFRQPTEFSRRISRNSQIILKEEAYFNKVADPAAGSYYIERLTDKIADAAWGCFQEIEQQGGMLKAIMGGYPQTAIEESREKRDKAIASRDRVFVGINQYPNTDDNTSGNNVSSQPAVSLKVTDTDITIDPDSPLSSIKKALQEGASTGDLIPNLIDPGKHDIRSIRSYRGPQSFEALRKATENHETTPAVLTIPMGNKKMRKARSAFAVNFLGCAGYDIEDPIGFESVDEAIKTIKEHQPEVVVLCSSDEEYETLVPNLCKLINQLDEKPIIVLAGYPEEQIETYKKAGIDLFIYSGSNVLEILKEIQQKLHIIKNDR